MLETTEELCERIRKELETEPHPITMTTAQWHQVLGILYEATSDGLDPKKDIRHGAVIELKNQLGIK